jgi:hypothetical protein
MNTAEARSIDHCVLSVRDLETARARLTALGFTVAPDGLHPFGTENCCLYFQDGTFVKPLAIADSVTVLRTASEGNVFTAHDVAFRQRHPDEEGFTALVFSTENAAGDHKAFVDKLISAGPKLSFSRPFVAADGKEDTASFDLAFAQDVRGPDALFFTCQRVKVPKVDRTALQRHANGATGLAEIWLTAPQPEELARLLTEISGAAAEVVENRLTIGCGGTSLVLMSPDEFLDGTGCKPLSSSAFCLSAIGFSVPDLSKVEGRATERGIVVPPAPGQATPFIFMERP